MPTLRIDRGAARDFALEALDDDDAPYRPVTNPSPFLSTDTLAAVGWEDDLSPPLLTPAVAWVDADYGQYLVSFVAGDTSDLAPSFYDFRVTVTRAGVTGVLFDGTLQIDPSPGPAITAGTPPTFPASGLLTQLDTVYCTDEDIALLVPQDFLPLCPAALALAYGEDGAFDTTSPWVLSSASVDFEAAGVTSGNVISLNKPADRLKGALFAVAAVNGHALMLRRLGVASGGQPPGPAGGTNGVTFEVRTYARMIDDVSFDLNNVFGIDPDVPGSNPVVLQRPRELRRLTTLGVLRASYAAAYQEKGDDWAMKLDMADRAYNDLRARLVLHLQSTAGVPQPTRMIGMRISR
jgi:hypothetical protein